MNISLEIAILLVQLVAVVAFFGALHQRVKTLELQQAMGTDTVTRLAAIEAKLVLLIPEMERVRTRLDSFLDGQAGIRFRPDGGNIAITR